MNPHHLMGIEEVGRTGGGLTHWIQWSGAFACNQIHWYVWGRDGVPKRGWTREGSFKMMRFYLDIAVVCNVITRDSINYLYQWINEKLNMSIMSSHEGLHKSLDLEKYTVPLYHPFGNKFSYEWCKVLQKQRPLVHQCSASQENRTSEALLGPPMRQKFTLRIVFMVVVFSNA